MTSTLWRITSVRPSGGFASLKHHGRVTGRPRDEMMRELGGLRGAEWIRSSTGFGKVYFDVFLLQVFSRVFSAHACLVFR